MENNFHCKIFICNYNELHSCVVNVLQCVFLYKYLTHLAKLKDFVEFNHEVEVYTSHSFMDDVFLVNFREEEDTYK